MMAQMVVRSWRDFILTLVEGELKTTAIFKVVEEPHAILTSIAVEGQRTILTALLIGFIRT